MDETNNDDYRKDGGDSLPREHRHDGSTVTESGSKDESNGEFQNQQESMEGDESCDQSNINKNTGLSSPSPSQQQSRGAHARKSWSLLLIAILICLVVAGAGFGVGFVVSSNNQANTTEGQAVEAELSSSDLTPTTPTAPAPFPTMTPTSPPVTVPYNQTTSSPTVPPPTMKPTNQPSTLFPTTLSPTASSTILPTAFPTAAATRTDDVVNTTNPRPVTYIPGNLTHIQHDLLLSEGLSARILALSGEPVRYYNGTFSQQPFHILPDAGAAFADTRPWNVGGIVYVSNSEHRNTSLGGVGAITIDKDGNVIDYRMLLENTTMNCGGGRTPWNTWVSCEEVEFDGKIYQVDPLGIREPQLMTLGSDGGRWESFAYDVRNKNVPRFFATEDHK